MFDKYKLVKFKNSLIRDPEMISKYASLGYFHYQYIKTLDLLNSSENLVRNNGVIKRRIDSRFKEGNYIEISIADFKSNRKIYVLFKFDQDKLMVKVGDLIELIEYVNEGMKLDGTNSFVKFDMYTIEN